MSVPITAALVDETRRVAFKAMRLWPVSEWEEGFADAMVGLLIAARDYRPELGVPFMAYARWRIRGEVIDKARLRWGRNDRSNGRANARHQQPIHLALDTYADPQAAARFEQIEDDNLRQNLARAINRLPERQRLIVTLYYFENLPMHAIADTLGLTESRICQIIKQIGRNLQHNRTLQTAV